MLEYLQSSCQEQAKPASGSAKPRAFRPKDEEGDYSREHGAYSSIDCFTVETAAGKPGFGSIILPEHTHDPCICQQKMRHVKNEKAPDPTGIPTQIDQAFARRAAPGHSQAVYLDVDDGRLVCMPCIMFKLQHHLP